MPTKADLKTDIQAWGDNTSVALSGKLDRIIAIAETMMARRLDLRCFRLVTSGLSLSAGNEFVTVPDVATMVAMNFFRVQNAGGEWKFLRQKSYPWIKEFWPNTSTTDFPLYYADYSATQWALAPVPAANSSYQIGYRARLVLAADGDTNWLTENAYDVFLARCLADAARFVMDDRQQGLITLNEAAYQRALDDAGMMELALSRDDYDRPQLVQENVPEPSSEAAA